MTVARGWRRGGVRGEIAGPASHPLVRCVTRPLCHWVAVSLGGCVTGRLTYWTAGPIGASWSDRFDEQPQVGALYGRGLGQLGAFRSEATIEFEIGPTLDVQGISTPKEHQGSRPAGARDVWGAAGTEQAEVVQQDDTVEALGVTVGFEDVDRRRGGQGRGAFDPQPLFAQQERLPRAQVKPFGGRAAPP